MAVIVSIHSFEAAPANPISLPTWLRNWPWLENGSASLIPISNPRHPRSFGLNEAKMGHTLNEFLRGECTISQVAFSVGENVGDAEGRKNLAGKALWLVPSSINSSEISRVLRDGYDVSRLNEGMQRMIKELQLDYLFIDTHPGLQEETLLSIAISDILLIVLRPDQQDFQGTAVTVDIARNLDVPNLFLIVNKALSKYDFKQVSEQVTSFYNAPVAAVFPLSEDMVDMGSADIFSLRFPDHVWSRALREVAQTLLNTASSQ
jgi:MinD-like ATPase involved in chromosome partitioning or flagellar assembly